MAVKFSKPDKYAKCACCGGVHDIVEFQFQKGTGIKTCITLCKPCVYHMSDMMAQDTINKLEAKNDKRPENN